MRGLAASAIKAAAFTMSDSTPQKEHQIINLENASFSSRPGEAYSAGDRRPFLNCSPIAAREINALLGLLRRERGSRHYCAVLALAVLMLQKAARTDGPFNLNRSIDTIQRYSEITLSSMRDGIREGLEQGWIECPKQITIEGGGKSLDLTPKGRRLVAKARGLAPR